MNVWNLKLSQTLYAYFQKNEQNLPAKSARTSNNHVEEVAKEMTAEGAKGRKRGPRLGSESYHLIGVGTRIRLKGPVHEARAIF